MFWAKVSLGLVLNHGWFESWPRSRHSHISQLKMCPGPSFQIINRFGSAPSRRFTGFVSYGNKSLRPWIPLMVFLKKWDDFLFFVTAGSVSEHWPPFGPWNIASAILNVTPQLAFTRFLTQPSASYFCRHKPRWQRLTNLRRFSFRELTALNYFYPLRWVSPHLNPLLG